MEVSKRMDEWKDGRTDKWKEMVGCMERQMKMSGWTDDWLN